MKQLLERELITTQKYGMYLERKGTNGWSGDNHGEGEWGLLEADGKYEVALPHSCDQWSITYGTKDQCIQDLKEFIEEAEKVLLVLESE